MTNTLAQFHAATGGWMTVTEDPSGVGYIFRIGGKTNSVMISGAEAIELADALARRRFDDLFDGPDDWWAGEGEV